MAGFYLAKGLKLGKNKFMKNKRFEKELFPDILDKKRIAYDPSFVAKRFLKCYEIYGKKTVDSHNFFQKAREMFTAAAFLYAFSEASDKGHMLAPVYNESTPDIYGYYCEPNKKIKNGKNRIVMNVEITDWEEHSGEKLSERVLNKLKNKAYSPNYHLLVYISREGEKQNILEEISLLVKRKLSVKAVWTIGSVRSNGKDTFQIINIYSNNEKIPAGFYLELNIFNFLKKKRNPFDFCFLIKSKGEDFFSGNFILEYPKFE